MIILGVDPGIATTGWAIMEPELKRVLFAGQIKTEPREPIVVRFATITTQLAEAAKIHCPTWLFVERFEFHHSKGVRVAAQAGYKYGIAEAAAYAAALATHTKIGTVTAREARLNFVPRGMPCSKQNAAEFARREFSWPDGAPRNGWPEHVIDAAEIAWSGWRKVIDAAQIARLGKGNRNDSSTLL